MIVQDVAMFDITFTVRDWEWQVFFVIPDAVILSVGEDSKDDCIPEHLYLKIIIAIKVWSIEWEDA